MIKPVFIPLVILFAFGFDNSQIAQAQFIRNPIVSTDWRYERDQNLERHFNILLAKCDIARKWNSTGISAYSGSAIDTHGKAIIISSRKRRWYLTEAQLGAYLSGLMRAMRIACPGIW